MPAGVPLKRAGSIAPLTAFAAIACVVARAPWRVAAGGQAHLALAQELALLVMAGVLVFVAGRSAFARDRITGWVLALVLTGVVSSLLSTNRWVALRSLSMTVGGAVVFLASRRTRLGAPLLLVPLVVATSVIAEAHGLAPGLSRTGHAPGGLIGERNAASELLVCALPLVAWSGVRAERARERVFAAIVAGLSVMAIVLTRTRSAWLATVLTGALGLGLAMRASDEARSRALPLGLAAIAGASIALLVPNALLWSSMHPYRETWTHLVDPNSESGHGRLVQYTNTLRMALHHPVFGVGPGNWSGRYLESSPDIGADPSLHGGIFPVLRLPQSDVFGFVAERGLAGIVPMVGLVVELARSKSEHRGLRLATVFAVAIVSTFDAVLQCAPHLFFVAAVLGAASPARNEATRVASRVGGATAFALAVPAALRLAALAFFVGAHGFADYDRSLALDPGDVPRRLQIASDEMAAGRCDEARANLRVAGELATVPADAVEPSSACAPTTIATASR